MHKIKTFLKKIRYALEALVVKLGIGLFRILGVKKSSNLGSFLARFIGKLISVHKLAKDNLIKALPHLNNFEADKILNDMWDNLGRVASEFVYISDTSGASLMKHIEVSDQTLENIKFIRKNYHGGIIFSGHLGNWEVGPKFFLENGFNVKTVYRPLNNSAVDDMTASIRGTELISKSSKGNKQIIQEIKNGNYVIILVDQKISDGVEIPFFGRPAKTTVSIAKLALKYNIPLIPARSIRVGKEFKFKIEVEKPIEFTKIGDESKDDAANLMAKVNDKLEEWIREYPAQWFWVHNRWKK